jgi:hypothetical protein
VCLGSSADIVDGHAPSRRKATVGRGKRLGCKGQEGQDRQVDQWRRAGNMLRHDADVDAAAGYLVCGAGSVSTSPIGGSEANGSSEATLKISLGIINSITIYAHSKSTTPRRMTEGTEAVSNFVRLCSFEIQIGEREGVVSYRYREVNEV